MKNSFQIEPNSPKPKYQQLIDEIIEMIKTGKLKRGDQLPTINEIQSSLGIARMTIIRAYEELRSKGIIAAHHGKGYYVATTDVKRSMHIFVLFDAMNAYKEILFNSLREALGEDVTTNLFFHYHDLKVFENIILNNIGNYNYYIVMPHFNEDVSEIVKQIPPDKLLILDIDVPQLGKEYSVLYQDFETNMYQGLQQGLQLINKYNTIKLVVSKNKFQYTPKGIIRGFERFCKEFKIKGEIINDDIKDKYLVEGDAYIIFLESDLIRFVNWSNKMGLKLGKDIGLLSYDDTPVKEILADEGITVITNDFTKMGKMAAKIIHNRKKGKVASSSSLIIRGSL
ncbi:regulatory protein, gntR family [Pseudarcicella hirudinis]|uniref:Regulatory protein, gntR family n=1 Tax=Pseudarcicella hirudinis TaxID=1079859 RepID=A0A1I5W0P6_9BACT|nr:GntR family transcriptional regulator [Pseudarcicella hirudinis]SFQ13324.1 regulatory protein, gntR family [Pseudarcicella hirudinis]